MGAFYAADISRKCFGVGGACGKPATHEVRGPRNESYGHFCRKHADAYVRDRDRDEARRAAGGQGST